MISGPKVKFEWRDSSFRALLAYLFGQSLLKRAPRGMMVRKGKWKTR